MSLAKAFNVDVDNVQYIGVTSSLTRRKLSGSPPDSGTDKQLINVVKVMVPINSKSYANFIGNPDGLYANLTVTAQTPEFNEGLEKTVRLNSVATPLTQSEIVTPNIAVRYLMTVNLQYVYSQPSASPTQGSYSHSTDSNKIGNNNNAVTVAIAVSLVAFSLIIAVVTFFVFSRKKKLEGQGIGNKDFDNDPLVCTDGIYVDNQSFSFDAILTNSSEPLSQRWRRPNRPIHLTSDVLSSTSSLEQDFTGATKAAEHSSELTQRFSDNYDGVRDADYDEFFINPFRQKKLENTTVSRSISASVDLRTTSGHSSQTWESFVLPFGVGNDETKIVFDQKILESIRTSSFH